MKKILSALFVCLCCIPVFASDFNISFHSNPSLYRESCFDPYGFNTELNYIYVTDPALRDIKFLVYVENNGKFVTEPISRNTEKTGFLKTKASADAHILSGSMDFGNIHELNFNLNIKAYLSSVFDSTGGVDVIAYDGSYFIGPEFEMNNTVLRVGIHHLSGHYGDEALNEFFIGHKLTYREKKITNDSGVAEKYLGIAQYVRDNSFLIGLQKEFSNGLTCYFEYTQPFRSSFVRPFFECPSEHKTSTQDDDETAWDKLMDAECISSTEEYHDQTDALRKEMDNRYKAARIHGGFIWSKHYKSLVFNAGLDVQAHQDGKTKHILGGYDRNNPWEFEYNGGISVDFLSPQKQKMFGIEIFYTDGRFPGLNLFNNRIKALTVGFNFNR